MKCQNHLCIALSGVKSDMAPTDSDVVPMTPQGDDGGFSEVGGTADVDESNAGTAEEVKKQMWIDFDIFCKCFKYAK